MSVNGKGLVLGALAASAALVIAYLLAGGGDYEPTAVADPCAPREWRDPEAFKAFGADLPRKIRLLY